MKVAALKPSKHNTMLRIASALPWRTSAPSSNLKAPILYAYNVWVFKCTDTWTCAQKSLKLQHLFSAPEMSHKVMKCQTLECFALKLGINTIQYYNTTHQIQILKLPFAALPQHGWVNVSDYRLLLVSAVSVGPWSSSNSSRSFLSRVLNEKWRGGKRKGKQSKIPVTIWQSDNLSVSFQVISKFQASFENSCRLAWRRTSLQMSYKLVQIWGSDLQRSLETSFVDENSGGKDTTRRRGNEALAKAGRRRQTETLLSVDEFIEL